VSPLVIRGEENYYICDVCGKKKPVSQMAGKCSVCGRFICSTCAHMVGDRIYCEQHVPVPPPQEQKTGCFIATAAYGSPLASELDVLRSFRDKRMLRNMIGKAMVVAYYTISPPIASVIAGRQTLKRIVRSWIDPIVDFLETRGF
jgi:hypothetical protein